MSAKNKKILIFGYGNPGRNDDGLGSLFVQAIQSWHKDNPLDHYIEFEENYQLNVEDALLASEKDIVVFVDASKENIESYAFEPIIPKETISFSTHAMSPNSIMNLCSELYDKQPKAYLLSIKGYEWEFKEGLSEKAEKNLHDALIYIKKYLQKL